MPELPEVEAARCLVERHCGGSTVKAVSQCEAGGGPRDGQWDDIVVCEGVDAARLAGALVGRKLASVRRKGKQLWFEMGGSGEHALFHFGMTGAFVVKGHAALKYQEFAVRDEQWPPKFCKLELTFANGARLAFADPRRLGRVRLRSDPEAEPPISKLAPDPLTGSGPDLAAFTLRMYYAMAASAAVGADIASTGEYIQQTVMRTFKSFGDAFELQETMGNFIGTLENVSDLMYALEDLAAKQVSVQSDDSKATRLGRSADGSIEFKGVHIVAPGEFTVFFCFVLVFGLARPLFVCIVSLRFVLFFVCFVVCVGTVCVFALFLFATTTVSPPTPRLPFHFVLFCRADDK